MRLVAKFAEHADPGYFLEKPQHGWDDRIRILRVEGRWRIVVLAPASGDTYCLVTVLPQDKAEAYAASRRFSVNSAFGVLEVRDELAIRRLQPSHPAGGEPDCKRLFADVSDADLFLLGVDPQILPTIRLLTSQADLERLQAALPETQYAAVYALACGMTVDEAWEEVARLHSVGAPPKQVDPNDLVSGNNRAQSRPGHLRVRAGRVAATSRPPVRGVAHVPAPEPTQDRLPGKLCRVGPSDWRPRDRQDGYRAAPCGVPCRPRSARTGRRSGAGDHI